MKITSKILGMLILAIVFVGCSSVKITDSWKDVETSQLKDKNILVMSKTNDNVIRTQFESDIVEQLSKKGYSSLESYSMFPVLNLEKPLTEKQLNKFKKELTDKGIDVIVMTELKDVNEFTKTTTTGGTTYSVSTYPPLYYRGYRRGFYRSYRTFYLDAEPTTTISYTGKNYILETFIYDLSLPEHNGLLSVITTKIENPETLGTTSKDFSKKLINELVK